MDPIVETSDIEVPTMDSVNNQNINESAGLSDVDSCEKSRLPSDVDDKDAGELQPIISSEEETLEEFQSELKLLNNQDLLDSYHSVSSDKLSVSEIEEGQIVESSSDCSEPHREIGKSSLKRHLSHSDTDEVVVKRVKKKISFSAVTAYYFPRAQGFTCVPSQGGSTLGMELKHTHVENLTLNEHAAQQRRKHRRLLLQLRKRRRNRNKLSAANGNGASSPSTKENEENKESETEDSEEQWSSDLSDSELDIDNYYFLQPVPTRQRRALLREAGVGRIETSEKDDCRQIRVSRESCGCSCQVYCEPELCSCAQSGIQCQVDRLNFPCGCSRDACGNPSGRVEFNPVRVRTHFIHTLMRLELEGEEQHANSVVQQQPVLTEEVAASSTAAPENQSGYAWENPDQLNSEQQQQPPQQQQQYCLTDTDAIASDSNWYSNYPEATSYALYSEVNTGAELFSYTASHYPTVENGLTYAETSNSVQQYTHLIDSGQGYSGEYYHGYSHGYSTFDSAYNYNITDSTYDACSDTGPVYEYPAATTVYNPANTTAQVDEAPKTESSSSSEEDALELDNSLATIVKETMVSV